MHMQTTLDAFTQAQAGVDVELIRHTFEKPSLTSSTNTNLVVTSGEDTLSQRSTVNEQLAQEQPEETPKRPKYILKRFKPTAGTTVTPQQQQPKQQTAVQPTAAVSAQPIVVKTSQVVNIGGTATPHDHALQTPTGPYAVKILPPGNPASYTGA